MRIKSKTNFVIALACAVCLIINIANQKDAFVIGICAVAVVGNLICAFAPSKENDMGRTEIKVGMMVVCKEAHHSDGVYWAIPYMDEAIGKPMTVMQVSDDMIFCQFDTDYPMDDGCWFFKADWLEPWKGEQHETD